MATAIHVEINALCLLLLGVIVFQSLRNVSQQMNRVLFRYLVYGVCAALALDILWILIDGRAFPGCIPLNKLVNALFLTLGVGLGSIWYLYVLETLGWTITRRLLILLMVPWIAALALNLASMWTGWIFFITPDNLYMRGPWFWVQEVAAIGMLLIPLVHILVRLARKSAPTPRHAARKLLGFYIVPVIATLAAMPYAGMPGTWTSAAISLVLMYMDDQDREILRDSLTGLNNRKTLNATFADYVKQASPDKPLYLFMMDLDRFKSINDTLGHPAGDQALVGAAKAITRAASGIKAIVARYGGDEFLVMGFPGGDDEAHAFIRAIEEQMAVEEREGRMPCPVTVSAGFARYQTGESFEPFVQRADEALYAVKQRKGTKR